MSNRWQPLSMRELRTHLDKRENQIYSGLRFTNMVFSGIAYNMGSIFSHLFVPLTGVIEFNKLICHEVEPHDLPWSLLTIGGAALYTTLDNMMGQDVSDFWGKACRTPYRMFDGLMSYFGIKSVDEYFPANDYFPGNNSQAQPSPSE